MPLFPDPFSSYRGPGVLGLLIGGLVLVALVALVRPAWKYIYGESPPSLEEQVDDSAALLRQKKLEVLTLREKTDVAREREHTREELGRLTTAAAKTAVTLEAEAGQLNDEIAALVKSLGVDYRTAVRKNAIDEEIPKLILLDGQVLKGVTIREVTPLGMLIHHQGRNVHIPWQDLPYDMVVYYRFSEAEAAEAARLLAEAKDRRKREAKRQAEQNALRSLQERRRDKVAEIGKIKQAIRSDEERRRAYVQKIDRLLEEADEQARLHKVARRAGRWSAHPAAEKRKRNEAAPLIKRNGDLGRRILGDEARVQALEDEIREIDKKIAESSLTNSR